MVADRTNLWKWLAVPLCAAAVACGDGGGDGDGETCDDAECVTPPAATCSGDVLVEYAATGSCGLDDACVYETTSTPCAAGCAEGACVDQAPCEGVTCDEPPAATCDGDTLLTFADAGTCDEASGDCSYAMTETDCTETGEQCRAGACVDVTNICEGVTCDAPPADSCNAVGQVVAYDAPGACNADTGECEYTSTIITCNEGLVCSAGACVDEGGACVDVVCDTPPAPDCDGPTQVTTYGDGRCDEATGECVFSPTSSDCDAGTVCFEGACIEDTGLCDDVTCTAEQPFCNEDGNVTTPIATCDPSTGECVSTTETTNCDEGFACLFGACTEDAGLCDDVTCDDPAPGCTDDGQLETGVGACNPATGECTADYTRTACPTGEVCSDGACVPESDPCIDVTCDPPAPFCNTAGQVVTSTDGVCDSADGTCSFTETAVACDAGFLCFDGACIEDAGLCDGVTCDALPASCSDDTTIVTYTSPVCDPADGLCDYTETLTPCDTDQLCRDGACVDTGSICDTIVCEPRDNSCFDDTTLLVWASECNADTGTCDETSSNVTCPGDGFCVLGECVGGSLCAGVTCPARAPICDTDGNPITFGLGTCDEFTGECNYTGTPGTCDGATVCDAGICVADLCDGVTCEPIGATCDIDGNLVTYGAGECQTATGDCTYPPTTTPCEAGDVCVDGACVLDTPCAGVVCDDIAPYCNIDGDPVLSVNACNEATGVCEATETVVPCGAGDECVDGECVEAATCATITCDAPPADTCDIDGNAVQYQAVGTCNDTTLECEYASSVVVCAGDTPTCVAGVCAGPALPGDIAITEVMYDLPGADDLLEWFEVQNVADVAVDLTGSVVFDTSDPVDSFIVGDLALAPGQVAVFGQSVDAAPVVDVDWGGLDFFVLSNTADEIIIFNATGDELDRVEYDEADGWPSPVGRSLSLDLSFAADNNNGANWCYGVDVYDASTGALGSPGIVNAACDFACYDVSCPPPSPTCDGDTAVTYTGDGTCLSTDGTCDYSTVTETTACDAGTEFCLNGACVPLGASIAPGDLTITEFMANPNGTDTDFEWFEVLNTSGGDLSLTGLLVTSGAGESFAVTSDIVLGDDNYIVFVQSDLAVPDTVNTINWGGEPVLLLANGGDEITLEWDGTVIDTLTFDPTWPIGSGTSAQFGGDWAVDDNADPSNWCLSITPYDDTSVGTPGQGNDGCGPTGDPIPSNSVFFTEVLQNPSGDDTGLEWFELYNSNATPISLDGVTITDSDGDSFTVPPGTGLEVSAFSFAVFGSSEAAAGGAVDYVYTGMSLANGDDELILSSAGAEVNRIEWDGGPNWPDPNGASMSLDPGSFLGFLNNSGPSWCEGVDLYDGTNAGTPGEPNPPCFTAP